jgi:hypothetical protein
MQKKEVAKITDVKSCLVNVNEPVTAYTLHEQKVLLPENLFSTAMRRSLTDVKQGRSYTTREVFDELDVRMGWR